MSSEKNLYQAIQVFEYEYPAPVREVCTELRLFPQTRRGGQRLRGRECRVRPRPDETSSRRDAFGNEVWQFRHRRVEQHLRFEVRLLIETEASAGAQAAGGCPVPTDPGFVTAGVERFLRPTHLADDAPAIRAIASELRNERLGGGLGSGSRETGREIGSGANWWQVTRVGRWVYETMEYRPGVTGVDTPAGVALGLRQGVCQDYAHLTMAICRQMGIPCRYISGFIPGEGYMHAWIEALVPHPGTGEPCWMGYDPTHCRSVDVEYLAIAAGRDFADVSPITGTFYGPQPGRLNSWCEVIQLRRDTAHSHTTVREGSRGDDSVRSLAA
jgi:transglutaminase-like putative cysteine protease